jgi:hypothetical protein
MYILEKVSSPGWTLEAEEIDICLRVLEQSVCKHCKMTKQDYDTFLDSYWADTEHSSNEFTNEDYEPDEFFPDHYKDMSPIEKIEALLATACGLEYEYDIARVEGPDEY